MTMGGNSVLDKSGILLFFTAEAAGFHFCGNLFIAGVTSFKLGKEVKKGKKHNQATNNKRDGGSGEFTVITSESCDY